MSRNRLRVLPPSLYAKSLLSVALTFRNSKPSPEWARGVCRISPRHFVPFTGGEKASSYFISYEKKYIEFSIFQLY